MNIIDIFSGAGGLAEGFLRHSDVNILAHVEMDTYTISTLKTRLFYHNLLKNNNLDEYYAYLNEEITRDILFENNKDILNECNHSIFNNEINNENIKLIIKKIEDLSKFYGASKIDGIIGGPPCQTYSLIGRSRFKKCMKEDSRTYLYKYYIHFLKKLNPDFFVFENVPGMLSAKANYEIFNDFINNLKNLDYEINYEILKANHFNVLQSRKRLIVIGYKKDKNFFDLLDYNKENNGYLVYDLLNDLPKLEPSEGTDSPQDYISKPSKYLKDFNIRNSKDKVLQHTARSHNERDREIYRIAIKSWNEGHKRIRYNRLPNHLKTHNNQKSFVDRFKVVAGDLPYSHTVMAHLSKDGHYFIHPDIEQARSITVREAARLQSFPDNYNFEGPRTSQFKQVGNAVPPLMAEKIANAICDNI